MKPSSLRISAWNANGLPNHTQKIILYLNINKIDILLISETHATDRTHVKIPYYTVYYANHPDNQAHAGAAIIIRTALKHHIQHHT
jgi:exonuclease III